MNGRLNTMLATFSRSSNVKELCVGGGPEHGRCARGRTEEMQMNL